MPALPIIALDIARAWGPLREAKDGRLLTRCIQASSDYIERRTGLRVVGPASAITELHDGGGRSTAGRYGEVLRLEFAPVLSFTSVKENGKLLTIATGYSTTADTILDSKRALLYRRTLPSDVVTPPIGTVGWSPGIQNIEVVYRPGMAASASGVPGDLVQACVELAWFWYNEPGRLGVQSQARAGKSASYEPEIPAVTAGVIASYRSWRLL